ncbi:Uncharacterised protein [Bordetella pertussis]|nr:Uncharacterised protein [Bordetella pertussis]
MRNSVDLPAPLGPMMPTMAPAGTLKLTLRFWYSYEDSSSKRAIRALALAWRPLGFWRTHSSSFLMVFWRADSVASSCLRRSSFCSSQEL